jgi:hypothetical protein
MSFQHVCLLAVSSACAVLRLNVYTLYDSVRLQSQCICTMVALLQAPILEVLLFGEAAQKRHCCFISAMRCYTIVVGPLQHAHFVISS